MSFAMCGPEMCVVNATPPDLGSIKLKNFEWRRDGEYLLSDLKGLENLCQLYKNGDAKHQFPGSETITRMTKDVVVPKDKNFPGIGTASNPVIGTIDGRGHTISGLVIKDPHGPVGFINCLGKSGVVKNLHLVQGTVTGCAKTGGLIGENEGLVEDCSNANTINGTAFVGGVVGYNNGGIVMNSKNTGNVTSVGMHAQPTGAFTDAVGGIVGGSIGGTLTGNTNTGTVRGALQAGGIVGYSEANVLNNDNSGTVRGWTMVGGVVGTNHGKGRVGNCLNSGNISSLAGKPGYDQRQIGGIVGMNTSLSSVVGCVNRGLIRGDDAVGGLVGFSAVGSVDNCVNLGEVIAETDAGGIIGRAAIAPVTNCLNLGVVSTQKSPGGAILGNALGDTTETPMFNNCFYARSDRISGAANGHDVEGATAVTLLPKQRQHIGALALEDVKTAQSGGNAEPRWLAEVVAAQHAAGAPSHVAELSNAAGSKTKEKEQPITMEPATTVAQKPKEEKEKEPEGEGADEKSEDTEEKGNEEETESQKDDVPKADAQTATPYDTIRDILARAAALAALRNQKSQGNDLLGMALDLLINPKDRGNAEPSRVGGPRDARDEADDVDADDDPEIPDLNSLPTQDEDLDAEVQRLG